MRSLLAVATVASLVSAAGATGASAADRGRLLSAAPVARLSGPQARTATRMAGFPAGRARHGISAYRLRYTTVGVRGGRATASALVVLPRGVRRPPTVAFEHGTLVRRSDAPSQGLDSLAAQAAVLSGAAGFTTVAPDYLGLGDGSGRQAYLHTRTEASASLDALRAARTVAHRHGHRLDPHVFVTGFSQGGHAAMALGRALQARAAPHLRLRALAPVSGVLDLRRAELPAIVAGRLDGRISAYNVSALLRSWQPIYHLYGSPAEAFARPYAARVARLFDGRHGDPEILAAMPPQLGELVTPAMLADLAHPRGGLRAGLRANDRVCRWAPRVPVRLFAARGDHVVTIANSERCARRLRARGVRVGVTDVGPVDHFPSVFAATPRVLAWFAALR